MRLTKRMLQAIRRIKRRLPYSRLHRLPQVRLMRNLRKRLQQPLQKKQICFPDWKWQNVRLKKTESRIRRKVEEVPEEEEEPVTIGSLAMPSYSAAQLASRVKKAGDAPDIVKDDITKVTLFDYSDIISGDVDDMEE